MAKAAHRAPRRALVWGLVLGLTPGLASAAPPDPEPGPGAPEHESSDAPASARLRLSSTAVMIEVTAVPIDDVGQPRGPEVELGAPPITTSLAAGRWRLETRGRGYQPFARELVLEPGEELVMQIEPVLIEGALLELRAANEASEGASVILDGVELCTVPCARTIAVGEHRIEISKRRHKPLHSEFEAVQADEVAFDVALEPATSRAPALVTGTVALASLTTAVVFTARSAQARRSLMHDLDAGVLYDQDDSRIDNGRRDAIIASAMYGVTGAVAALTLYYLLRQSGRSSQAQKSRRSLAEHGPTWLLAPNFGPRGGAVALTVGF